MSALVQASITTGFEWTPVVTVLTPFVLLLLTSLFAMLRRRLESPTGSPRSESYARARLKEALSQFGRAPDDGERAQFSARVSEARILVEAHEARRRVAPGTSAPAWILIVFLALIASVATAAALAQQKPGLWVIVVLLVLLLFGVQLVAMLTSTTRAECLDVLIAAGRYGHSSMVRTDPSRVLREYDHSRAKQDRRVLGAERGAEDRASTTRAIRFERALVGQRLWRYNVSLDHDVWASTADVAEASPRRKRIPLPNRHKEVR